ncbi:MAG TPA: hypothetical protein VF669_13375 [Tepidisphaeraceae bacterium]|jgi:hypothetical protein
MTKVYEEIVEFIAGGTTPNDVVSFQASDEAKDRVAALLQQQQTGGLSEEGTAELAHYLELEHIMRLAKARARTRVGRQPL